MTRHKPTPTMDHLDSPNTIETVGRSEMNERAIRFRISQHGKSLFARGLTFGSSGNISVRLSDGMLITPTNSCLGRMDPERISRIGLNGAVISGDQPSKEAFLHQAVYQSRPAARAVVHLHSTASVAVSCLANIDPADVLPAITAYYVMRIGRLPLVPYFPPGDKRLAEEVARLAESSKAVLLANHGPVVSGKSLDAAVYATEELEETAKLYLMLRDKPTRFLTDDQRAELVARFGDEPAR